MIITEQLKRVIHTDCIQGKMDWCKPCNSCIKLYSVIDQLNEAAISIKKLPRYTCYGSCSRGCCEGAQMDEDIDGSYISHDAVSNIIDSLL